METPVGSTNGSPLKDQSKGIELDDSTASITVSDVAGEGSENVSSIVEESVDNVHSEDLFKSIEPSADDIQEKYMTVEDGNEEESESRQEGLEEDDIVKEGMEDKPEDESSKGNVIAETEDEMEETEDPMELEEDDDDDEDENENISATQLPVGRIRKIMKICVNTVDKDDAPEEVPQVLKKGKHRGKGKVSKKVSSSTASMIVTKEAIFLTTVATELFIAAVTQQSSRITAATKKKTMAVDHLKRAMSDSDCFEFLQGCFQPSLIIGD